MANINPPGNGFGHGYTASFSLESHLPFGVPWLFGSPTPLEGVAFWYRPDHSDSMPRRHILKQRGDGILGPETIKHRRTRNGCFTCRNRRVKCDEARPVCDRCRKGNRQCEFPPPIKPSKRRERASVGQTTPRGTGTASEDESMREKGKVEEVDDGRATDQAPVKTEGSPEQSLQTHSPENSSQLLKDSNQSPSPEGSGSFSTSVTPPSLHSGTIISSSTISARNRSLRSNQWAHLPADVQKHLQYQLDEMTYHHYFFKLDSNNFVHTDFIDLALEYEPLLYAVTCFAAYHHSLERPDGKLSDFLGYYSKALSLLRTALCDNRPRTPATFLTILQLATFEEYLGDWVHLFGHHRAAYHLLTEIYTPENVFDTEVGRQIFAWYSRFDVIVGMMSGNQTVVGREWYVAFQNYYDDQIDPEDVDIENGLAAASAATCLIGLDMASLYAKLPQGLITVEDFMAEGDRIGERISNLRERLQNLNDGYYTVEEFPDQVALTSEDIVDPYKPGGLFRDAFWPLNFLWIGFYGVFQMHTLSMLTLLQQPLPPEMEVLSLDQCRIFEAIERWPASPKGSLLGCHESLAIAAVFIKKDERHSNWCRRKFATVSRSGYMFPITLRQKMAELWQIPDITEWWLPNEEGLTPLLREIHAFGKERMTPQLDETNQKIRDISAIFSGLEVQREGAIGA